MAFGGAVAWWEAARQVQTEMRFAIAGAERIAQTDPYKQINDYVGSGPMRFVADERISAETTAKIEKARNEKLISEYVGKD